MRRVQKTGGSLACHLSLIFLLTTLASAAPGRLDPDFGTAGKVTTDFGSFDVCLATAPTALGEKWLLVGYSSANFALALYNRDGSLDAGFGSGGKVVTDFSGMIDQATCAAIRPAGFTISDPAIVIVAGQTQNGSGYDFGLARYDPVNGSLFSGFGTGGKVITHFGGDEEAEAVAFQNDGRIVVAGTTNVNGPLNRDFALARYNTVGELDATFGSAGRLVTDHSGANDDCRALAIMSDRRILAAGSSNLQFFIVRYLENGSIDDSFGFTGKVFLSFPGQSTSRCNALTLLPEGKILAAGQVSDGMALVRFTEDGTLDPTFGGGDGTVVLDESISLNIVSAMTIQADGKILVSGEVQPDEAVDVYDFGVMRFNSDGSLDRTFGMGGRVRIDFGGAEERAEGILLRADGTITVGGATDQGPNVDFAVASIETAQGDVRVGTRASIPVGNDRYNPSGAGQQIVVPIRRGGSRNAFGGIENDGAAFDTFRIRGSRGNARFAVRYFAGRANVTSRMATGRYFAEINSGASVRLKTTLVAKTSRPRQMFSIPLRATSSNDPGANDLARIRMRSR